MLRAEVVDAGSGSPCRPTRVLVVEATSGLAAPRGVATTIETGLVTAEGLWPGLWRIWVEVPNLAPAMKEFPVAADSQAVELRVEVPARGTLAGRVDFGDLPPTELLYVHALNRLALSGATPSWLRQGDLVGRFPYGSVGREFEFPLAPGEYVVQAFGKDTGEGGITAVARTVVRIEPGERLNVDLRMGPASHIRFQGGIVPGWVAELWMAEGDGELELRDRYVGGGILTLGQSVSPGTYRWRVRFLADDVVHDGREVATPVEGTVTVAAGKTEIVPVAAIPIPK